ncbi:MAG TPA: pteridine reductase [Gammaproteobacteria bacterium]|nr:pteridine reductase [Gammaproteobacteria bacterium]
MQDNTPLLAGKVALITGAAHRIGAALARGLHRQGMNLAIHYHTSRGAALSLQHVLNRQREESVILIQADLTETSKISSIVKQASEAWGHLDVLINNASSFYPTEIGTADERCWEQLIGTNLKAPFFLCQAAAPYLAARGGSIVNIADIHALRPLKKYPIYSITKAGIIMLTKAMACELGPEVRVNAVAPGAILWPEQELDELAKQRIISRTFLKRQGSPEDVLRAVLYLIRDADYVSGEILTVDGGRSVNS